MTIPGDWMGLPQVLNRLSPELLRLEKPNIVMTPRGQWMAPVLSTAHIIEADALLDLLSELTEHEPVGTETATNARAP